MVAIANALCYEQRKQKKVLDPPDLTQTQFVLLAALGWLAKKVIQLRK